MTMPTFQTNTKQTSCSISARCQDCVTEIGRRNRLLRADSNPTAAAQKLADPRWQNCVYITPFNKVYLIIIIIIIMFRSNVQNLRAIEIHKSGSVERLGNVEVRIC